jgi:hypothetical protein
MQHGNRLDVDLQHTRMIGHEPGDLLGVAHGWKP